MQSLTTDIKIKLLYEMLRIRRIQEHIESIYLEDEMKTPIHLCIGQEAVAAGVCMALDKNDYIMSNHRGHGHYLAKGGDLNSMIAELHCKVTGCSKGYGGSMHLIDKSVGHFGSSSIVAGGIPIGTGLGLSIKMKGSNQVSVIFFGDGAADEGVLYESINFSMLKHLPVIFVLENNHWAVCSHISARQKYKNIFHYAPEHALNHCEVDGNNVIEVFQATTHAVERARKDNGPSFIECKTYRVLGHAGCAQQDVTGYRQCSEVDDWKSKCPINNLLDHLSDQNSQPSEEELAWMETKIKQEIHDAFEFARNSGLPDDKSLNQYLYCER